MVCYWGSWSSGLPSSKIDANICTHVVYSFVGVTTDGRITNVDLGPVNDGKTFRFFFNQNKTILIIQQQV